MKNPTLLLAIAALAIISSSQPAAAQKPEDEVLKVVNTLFEGMRKKDTAMMRSTLGASARLVSTSTRNGAPVVSDVSIDRWMTSVSQSTSALDEKIFTPEVRVSDNLATVWTRYELHVNGTLSHCGYDAFQLARTAAGWKIVQIADTQTRENCTR